MGPKASKEYNKFCAVVLYALNGASHDEGSNLAFISELLKESQVDMAEIEGTAMDGDGSGGFKKTGDLSNKSPDFKREVDKRLNDWEVNERTMSHMSGVYMDISARRKDDQRHEIIKSLEDEWRAQGLPWCEVGDGDVQQELEAPPSKRQRQDGPAANKERSNDCTQVTELD